MPSRSRASPYQARDPRTRRSPRLPSSSSDEALATRRSPRFSSSSPPNRQPTPSTRRSPRLAQAQPRTADTPPTRRAQGSINTSPTLRATPPTRRSPQLTPSSSAASVSEDEHTRRAQVSLSPRSSPMPGQSPELTGVSASLAGNQESDRKTFPQANLHLYQLVVRPIVTSTIGQRDTSGDTLDDIALNGASFMDILRKIWVRFSPRIKGRAVKTDNIWSVAVPTIEDWSKVIQLKSERHIVDSTKTQHQWNAWLVAVKGKTMKLLVYEYGIAITRASDLAALKAASILPSETDRAGATAETCLQEIVERFQQQWDSTFQGAAVVWRMWANHLTRNLDRLSTAYFARSKVPVLSYTWIQLLIVLSALL